MLFPRKVYQYDLHYPLPFLVFPVLNFNSYDITQRYKGEENVTLVVAIKGDLSVFKSTLKILQRYFFRVPLRNALSQEMRRTDKFLYIRLSKSVQNRF